jgi:serine/threonine protein kinase/Tol biopolymer transport system component
MPEIGQTISHYRILEIIGVGGMGEVFLADDLLLDRKVALKFLQNVFTGDPERMARFEREAKLLASLNHPNIAAIYGLEQAEGKHFLVLELVEGETLAAQIKKGPVPAEESLKLALQIAEALEAAHEKGVIHRDLKPANINVTPDGKVKVLDFGLAKAFTGDQVEVNLSNSPTLSDMATQQGVILGTAAYMSPEQARGKPVDKRADIWAFGCVLYEMLTGRAAFQGEDVTEILAAVVKSGVNLDLLPSNIHPRVREVITRCLKKDLKKRYQDIGDVRYEMDQALADHGGLLVQPVTGVEPQKKLWMILPWVAAAIVLTAILAGAVAWSLRKPEVHQVIRFDYNLPEGQQFNPILTCLSVSPDGRQIVYSTNRGLYLRSMDELNARCILTADDNPQMPFFSPDGRWVGYYSAKDKKLKKIATSGAGSVDLCDSQNLLGASWNVDNIIVYTERESILRVSGNGGIPERLIEAKKGEAFYHPQLLPDGKSLIFTLGPAPYKVAAQSLESGDRKILFPGDSPWYLPTGHIVYASANNLFAIPFDLDNLQETGDPVRMIEGVFRFSAVYTPNFAVSTSGTLVYMPEVVDVLTGRNLVWVDRRGKEEVLKADSDAYFDPRISPDGGRVALSIGVSYDSSIAIWDLVRESLMPISSEGVTNFSPLWSLRDGKRIFFASDTKTGGSLRIFWKASDGTGEVEQLYGTPEIHYLPLDWSRDGTDLIVIRRTNNDDIGAVSMEGEHKWRPLLTEKYSETEPRISPDGKWMAYTSYESGRAEVYVCPFPDVESGSRKKVSNGGGNMPLWSPDTTELFYRKGGEVMAVQVKTEPEFTMGMPKLLFRGPYVLGWDISPVSKRFLMIKEAVGGQSVGSRPRKINIVLNWFEELKERVPTD